MAEEFEIKKFNLDEIDVRTEKSKYPFEELREIGDGFVVKRKGSSISGRVAQENKRGEKQYVTRQDPASTAENPITNVIRVK